MRQLRFSLAVLAATMACAACTVDQTGTIEATRRIEIAAEMETTKTELNYDGKFLWSAGDELGVFGLTTKNARFATDIQHSSAYATFSGEIGYDDEPQFCYYPYVEGANDVTAVPMSLQTRQLVSLNEENYILGPNNPKTGTLTEVSEGKYSTAVKSHMSLLKFKIDARGTDLYGMRLDKITIKRDGATLTGNFKANVKTGKITPVANQTYDYAETVVETRPYLTSVVQTYTMIYPDIPAGSTYTIEIMASNENGSKTATFTRSTSKDMKDGTAYNMSLVLANFDLKITNSTETKFNSFSIEASKNSGKILGTELYYANGATKTRTATGVTATINTEEKSINAVIPYLYDFKLAATFTVPSGVKVYVGSTLQQSGVTVNDFSQPVVYRVVAGEGTQNEVETQYVANIANTGLPVVVINQSTTMPAGDNTSWVTWSNTGIKLRHKESEWAEDDKITIYNNDGSISLNTVDGGIRLRGNVSQEFPKKPFAIKFKKKQEVLGMPAHKRWCLLANWLDRTAIRNDVSFALANQTIAAWQNEGLEEGLTYNPRGQHVEVVYNGIHVGNYLLCEQIKIDENRVNIQKEYDADEPKGISEVGYLIEFDDSKDEVNNFSTSRRKLPCQLKDEVPVNGEHWNYVKNKVQGIEDNLYNKKFAEAYKDLDIYSVIDQWFIFELAMNDEYRHPKSVYYYMDGDKKLKAGPVWDFDWQTFPNFTGIKEFGSRNPNYVGWFGSVSSSTINIMMYTTSSSNYMWYSYLVKDSATFNAAVKERWNVMKPYLQNVVWYIDMLAEQNAVSVEYDRAMWPIESKERKSSHAFSGDERMTYEEAIAAMKTFINERVAKMDAHFNSL
ncbi:MAG: CotH kinase family protein [Rikenellaceae bacterium]|nr:CotH kinase family protein [Rikenellaceae bacterium]